MIGRAIRAAGADESRHQVVIEVTSEGPRITYLGVQLGDVDAMPTEAVQERIAALRGLLVSQRLPHWFVQGISTEVGLLEAIVLQRISEQLTIDQVTTDEILPPIDGVGLDRWSL